MKKKSHLTPENQKRLAALKAETHKKLVKRGLVQFRADEKMLSLLMRVANHKEEPLGVMVRDWVAQRLASEVKTLPLPEITLPNGRIITDKSPLQEIEKALLSHQQNVVKLKDKDYRTLMNWLLDRHLAAKYEDP